VGRDLCCWAPGYTVYGIYGRNMQGSAKYANDTASGSGYGPEPKEKVKDNKSLGK